MSAASPQNQEPLILVAGASPGASAGGSVTMELLLAAASPLGLVGTLSHSYRPWPLYSVERRSQGTHITLGTQPVAFHAEALLAGRLFANKLRRWSCAWAVNSRYAGALMASGMRYAIWEATTIRDELAAADIGASRRAGRGTGLVAAFHKASLPFGEAVEGLVYRHAAVLTALSEYTRRRMIEIHGLTDRPIHVLLPPPTPAFLQALAEERAKSGALRNGARAGLRLLAVGRMDDPRKNFPLLLEAFRLVRDSGKAFSLTVAGPHSTRWRQSLNVQPDAENITFLGDVTVRALARAYLDHDMLVLPSKQEGFGIVVSEALHAGLPVVSTRCGGPEQALLDSGGGLLVDMNAESMARAIVELSGDPITRDQIAESAGEFAIRRLSFDRFQAEVAEVTRSMLRD